MSEKRQKNPDATEPVMSAEGRGATIGEIISD